MSGWRTSGFCLQGYSHLKAGLPCQDAYRSRQVTSADGESVHVLAVADGAGSRARSAEGATLAVFLATKIIGDVARQRGLPAVRQLGRPADEYELEDFLQSAYQQIRAEFCRIASCSAGGPEGIGLFATTLVVAVLAEGRLGIIQVGDGFIATRTAAGRDGSAQFHLLPPPVKSGEYANETVFITSPGGQYPSIYPAADPGITGVFLSTDGLERPALRWGEDKPAGVNASFIGRILDHLDNGDNDPRDVIRTIIHDNVVARTGDDITLLAAVRK